MSIKKLVAVLVLVLGLGIQSANAAPITFNFMDYANVNGEKGYQTLVWPSGSLTLTITATAPDDDLIQYYAYTDNGDINGPGGLGVCKDVNGSNLCKPLGEDNMTPGEMLDFVFNQDVDITELVFSNHAFAGITTAVGITADAIPSNLTLAPRVALLSVNAVSYSGSHFTMTANDGPVYLTSMTIVPVPEPGSLSLMGLGILGLSFLRRRK
ncbi:MAG: PEP-CTERM sorting domain-containing protein [bacterium]